MHYARLDHFLSMHSHLTVEITASPVSCRGYIHRMFATIHQTCVSQLRFSSARTQSILLIDKADRVRPKRVFRKDSRSVPAMSLRVCEATYLSSSEVSVFASSSSSRWALMCEGPILVYFCKSYPSPPSQEVVYGGYTIIERQSGGQVIFGFVCAALFVAFSYSAIIIRHREDKVWDWWNTVISTAVSVTLAIASGIYLFRLQSNEQDAQDRVRWKELVAAEYAGLQSEINGMPMNVNFSRDNPPRTIPIFITYIQPLATEQAALSGKFSPATSQQLLALATAARAYNMKATYALELLAQRNVSPNYAERVAHAALNLEQSRDGVRINLQEAKQMMENN